MIKVLLNFNINYINVNIVKNCVFNSVWLSYF